MEKKRNSLKGLGDKEHGVKRKWGKEARGKDGLESRVKCKEDTELRGREKRSRGNKREGKYCRGMWNTGIRNWKARERERNGVGRTYRKREANTRDTTGKRQRDKGDRQQGKKRKWGREENRENKGKRKKWGREKSKGIETDRKQEKK